MPLRLEVPTLEAMAGEHVFYEVERLTLWSTVGLPPEAFTGDVVGVDPKLLADVVGQATLESALLHLRNTIDFITDPRPTNRNYETDLVADDYFDDGWASRPDYLLGGSVPEHKQLMTEVHRRLAHLTTHRLTGAANGQPCGWGDVIENVPTVVASFR